jgi:Fe-S oxidoreductase
MEEMVNIYLYGKQYVVPASATILIAMEYAGYKLVRGCGCRAGFCGACATIYRIKGDRELKVGLACGTQVVDNMYIATTPYFPMIKQIYDIMEIKPTEQIMMQLYPEIYSCIGCNACTKGCPQKLEVMQYIAYAQRGEYAKCARASFDCIMCGICASRCPAGISHPQVAILARRLYGKYIAPPADHLDNRLKELEGGGLEALVEQLMNRPIDEIKELYDTREIEKEPEDEGGEDVYEGND